MERWARGSLRDAGVDFYCVCVDEVDVAINFGRLFQFKNVINCWIPSERDMPSYGQLGCSGFIVIGTKGQCISRATDSFLKVGPEQAFYQAEVVMRKALPPDNISNIGRNGGYVFTVGTSVRLDGVKSQPQLNGVVASIVAFDTTSGRYIVELGGEGNIKNDASKPRLDRISVRPCCIAPLSADIVSVPTLEVSSPLTGECTDGSCSGVSLPSADKSLLLDPPDDAASTTSAETIVLLEAPLSVGYADIDEDHVHCTLALNKLLAEAHSREGASVATFQEVVDALEAHFKDEEAFVTANSLKSHARQSALFSAFQGHKADHERMLHFARRGQHQVAEGRSTSLQNAKQLAHLFSTHVTDYDTLLDKLMTADSGVRNPC
jgi:hemerythrin